MHEGDEASRVARGLWVGSRPSPMAKMVDFDVLVLAAQEYQPRKRFGDVLVVHAPLDDSGRPVTFAEQQIAMQAATIVVKALARGDRVLVTCMQGKNRSGLIAALALRTLGASASQAVAAVRAARGDEALSNPYFLQLLRAARIRARA